MPQTVFLSDETQEITAELSEDFPVLYSEALLLRQAILRINDLHAVEPIDTVVYEADVAPYIFQLTTTLLDARVAKYRFQRVESDAELFVIEFTGGAWEETSLDLLNVLKNGVLILNDSFVMESLEWESI